MSHIAAPCWPRPIWFSLSFVFVVALAAPEAQAQAMEILEPIEDTSLLIEHLDDNKLRVHGREWDAKAYCTPESIDNGDLVRAYRLQSPEGESLVVHCPGMLDGEMNRVTVFTSGQKPRTLTVKPAPSSHRIDEATLRKSVAKLFAAPSPSQNGPQRGAQVTSPRSLPKSAQPQGQATSKTQSSLKKTSPPPKKKKPAKKTKRATA